MLTTFTCPTLAAKDKEVYPKTSCRWWSRKTADLSWVDGSEILPPLFTSFLHHPRWCRIFFHQQYVRITWKFSGNNKKGHKTLLDDGNVLVEMGWNGAFFSQGIPGWTFTCFFPRFVSPSLFRGREKSRWPTWRSWFRIPFGSPSPKTPGGPKVSYNLRRTRMCWFHQVLLGGWIQPLETYQTVKMGIMKPQFCGVKKQNLWNHHLG